MTPSARSFNSHFFFNDTATTEIYTLSLHDALPIHQRRLQIDVGVQARGETEVAADERAGLLVELERPPFRQCRHDLIICHPARTGPAARQAGVPDPGAMPTRRHADAPPGATPTVSSLLTSAREHPPSPPRRGRTVALFC